LNKQDLKIIVELAGLNPYIQMSSASSNKIYMIGRMSGNGIKLSAANFIYR